MTSRALAQLIANTMLSKKAHDVITMDLRKVTSTADFFVVCSADSDTQVRAIADAVDQATDEAGSPVWKQEGRQAMTWVILDFVDVVAHVFHRESRTFYNLERLWADAKTVAVTDEPPVKKPAAKKAAVKRTTIRKASTVRKRSAK
ncbi:MAG: ribosome silencing factor [Bacteroidetes bacterium]|nr:ribosome silencing factor [Bacteroidota bacterium]